MRDVSVRYLRPKRNIQQSPVAFRRLVANSCHHVFGCSPPASTLWPPSASPGIARWQRDAFSDQRDSVEGFVVVTFPANCVRQDDS